jgi:hypothetical protein
MRSAAFTKYLNSLSPEELQKELKMLYSKIPAVKDFYKMELGDEKARASLYKKVKAEIDSRYATKSYRRPRKPRIQKVNKLLSDMKKKSIFSHELVDLYIYDLEQCIALADEYHIFTTVMYNHINQVFEKAIEIIMADKLEDMFKERIDEILDWTRKCWEEFYHLEDLYDECYGMD